MAYSFLSISLSFLPLEAFVLLSSIIRPDDILFIFTMVPRVDGNLDHVVGYCVFSCGGGLEENVVQ